MAKNIVDEKRIQCTALHYLHYHYYLKNSKYEGLPFYVNAEERTLNLRGRADGLIVIQLPNKNPYVISLEAKSMKLMKEIKITDSKFKYGVPAFLSGTGITVISILVGWSLAWYWLLLIGVLSFVIGVLAYATVAESYLNWFLDSKVVKQIKRYPGHESWIAIPAEALNRMEENGEAKDFINICRQRKAGLLTVNRLGIVNEIITPKPIEPDKNLLKLYYKSETIRRALNSKSELEKLNYGICNRMVSERRIVHYNSKPNKIQPVSIKA